MSWENAVTLSDKHSNKSIFVKLVNNGDKVVGAFCGEPFAREVVWAGDKYEDYDASNEAHKDKRPTLKVTLNFYVLADSTMRIIQGGASWFKDLLKLRSKYGLNNWTFEIERHGAPGDPKTSYSILPDEKIDAELRSKIDATPLHNLCAMSIGNA